MPHSITRTTSHATGHPGRTLARAAAWAAAVIASLAACTPPAPAAPTPSHRTGRTTRTSHTPAAPTSVAPPKSATAASGPLATTVLAGLTVRGGGATGGYSRAAFGQAYADAIDGDIPSARNGCDQRNDIRRRDAVSYTLKPRTGGCVVKSATFDDPYTGKRIPLKASGFEHVVALRDAWISGAADMTADRRADIAGDPLNLLIVDSRTNMSKGDRNAAQWLPPNTAFRCAYVSRQIAVKARYRLTVTKPERDAMAAVLAGCPSTRTPTEADVTPPEPRG